jgi:hypothetical protein
MILFSQFIGTWYYLYHLPNEQDDNMACPTEKYGVPVGNSSMFVTNLYDKQYVHKQKSLI